MLKVFYLVSLLMLASCTAPITPVENPVSTKCLWLPAQLRITNFGPKEIKGLSVMLPSINDIQTVYFGDIAANQTTEYKIFACGVFRGASFVYQLDGKDEPQPVDDWLGEKPLPGSKFTYQISFDPNRELGLRIRLENVVTDVP